MRLICLHALASTLKLSRRTTSSLSPAPTPQRILVIKPDHLGDVLLMTPALRRLRQHHPQAHIAALVGPWSAFILERNPDIDVLLTLPFPGFERGKPPHPWSVLHPYSLLLHTALLLRAGHFDTALLLRDDHWWGAVLVALAGIPQRVGHALPESRPFLTVALPWKPRSHVTAQALAVVTASGDRTGGMGEGQAQAEQLNFEPASADTAWISEWQAQAGIAPTDLLVMIHPGTGGAAKLWLPERWAEVADTLIEEYGARVVFTGGTGEAALVESIIRRMHNTPLSLVGATSVGQLAALFRRAALVLGVDSGPLHLAVSQGAATIHLYGASDAERFGPWGERGKQHIVRSGLWCSPCGVFEACPRGTEPPECMTAIAVEQIVALCCLLREGGEEG